MISPQQPPAPSLEQIEQHPDQPATTPEQNGHSEVNTTVTPSETAPAPTQPATATQAQAQTPAPAQPTTATQAQTPAPTRPWHALLAFATYLAAALAFTWPLVQHINDSVLGFIGFENTAQTLWIFHAWQEYQLDILRNFQASYGTWGCLLHLGDMLTASMTFPDRNSVANGLDFFWTVPLAKLFGFPAYYNVKCWLVLALNGLAARYLARLVGCSRLSAWAAGFVFAFNPFHFYLLTTGRMIESQTFLPVLAMATLYLAWRRDEPLRWALAGAMLGLVTDNYWFYGHFTILYVLLFLVYNLIRRNPPRLGRMARNLVFYLLAFTVVVLPFAQPYLVRLAVHDMIPGMIRPDPGNQPSMINLTRQMICFSADYDYPLFQPPKSLPSNTSAPWWNSLQCTFLANLTLLAILPALFRRRGGFWLVGAFLFYLLPLGPFLKVQGQVFYTHGSAIPLPYLYLIQYYPLINKLFWPNQSMFLLAICLSILIALNLDWLRERRGLSPLIAPLAVVVLLTVSGLEMVHKHQLPLPQTPLTIPPLYQSTGRDAGYIFLPLGRRYWEVPRDFNRDYYHGADLTVLDLHLAMSHGKGLFGRPHYMAGKDYWLYEISSLTTQPFLRWIVALGERPSPAFSAADQRQVQDEGYRYLVVHERFCAHIQDRGSYTVNLKSGEEKFAKICHELQSRYGKPIYQGREESYDQGLVPGSIASHPFRIAIFDIGK